MSNPRSSRALRIAAALAACMLPVAGLPQDPPFTSVARPPGCHIAEQRSLGEWKEQFKIQAIEEVLLVNGPTMEMSAQLECPLEDADQWDVGYIQLVQESRIALSYGGYDFVIDFDHFPLLDAGLQKPWTRAPVKLRPGVVVYFRDGPQSAGGWYTKHRDEQGEFRPTDALDGLQRHSVYDAYLVAMNRAKKTYFVLQRVRWELVLDLGVDVSKPIEKRVEGRAARIQVLEVDNEKVDPPGPEMLTAMTPKQAARMGTVPHPR